MLFLVLVSVTAIASVRAANDYELKIEFIPPIVEQGGTVTIRIHADILGYDDYATPNGALVSVSIRGWTAPNTAGIFVFYPGGGFTNYRNDLSPIIIQNGVPSEDLDYVDVTFGTNAPGKNNWSPASMTDLIGSYLVDFQGFVYMSDGSDHWFDIPLHFSVVTTPHDGDKWVGYTPGWWKTNAEKLLAGRPGTQLTLAEYEAAVDCVWDDWSADLPWLPTSVSGALAIFSGPGTKSDPVVKARIMLLAYLLSLCHFGEDFAPVTISGSLGTFTMSPADWAVFLVNQYKAGNCAIVYEYANLLNNY